MRKENDNNCLKMNKKAPKIWKKYFFLYLCGGKVAGRLRTKNLLFRSKYTIFAPYDEDINNRWNRHHQ